MLAQFLPFSIPNQEVQIIDGTQVPTIRGFQRVFANTILAAIGFAAIAAFIFLLIGGFQYLTSAGNPEKVAKASKTITYSLGGFFLVIGAILVLRLLQQFTGVPLTCFQVTIPFGQPINVFCP